MRKYTIAHSFLMITSVLASGPFHVNRRQIIATPTTPTPSAQTTAVQSSPASTSPTAATSPPATSSLSSPSSSPLSASSITLTPSISTSTTSAPTTPTISSSTLSSTPVGSTSSLPSTSSSSILETTSASTSTDAQGSPVTVIVTSPVSPTSSPSPSATSAPQSNSSHTGTIVGLSVAGGIAAVGIIAFIIWKLTRKRFSDLDDPDEAIKWPELNQTHTDLGNELSPQTSNTYPANASSRNASMLDHTEHPDPYAVPPLPQFNPNQPYRDDPYASSNAGYYDPYRGPIPQTFHDGSVDGHENIPMSTYPPGSRSRSPGPGMAYDMRGRASPAPGRASPALGPVYDTGGRGSPAPGRNISPGPAAALGLDRRPTYDVQNAYSGPTEMAPRNRSPGPNILG